MKTNPILNFTIALALFVSTSGCASVMSGPRKNITIHSNPAGAQVRVTDREGSKVASLTTPCVVSLKRGAGYFVGANYLATISKPGYQALQVNIGPTGNPWSLGNLILGGLIGFTFVDPLTGAMYGLTPSSINAQLIPIAKH